MPSASSSPFDTWLRRFINDERDLPFLKLTLLVTALVPPFAGALFVPGVFRWWLALAYALVVLRFVDRFILMLHFTSHRPLFKARYRILNGWIPWVLGPFFGETPETYFAHHVGMHHPEGNLPDDLSSTMRFRRDSLVDFLRYYGRFMVTGLRDLARYLKAKRRGQLRRKALTGELAFVVVAVVLLALNWRAALLVFVAPVLLVRFLMMAGNWGQHVFVCAEQPGNAFRNSITVIDCAYNARCFNDGYHIGHHLKASRHWTELPVEFEANRAEYFRQGALVFAGIDFFGVWLRLMLRRYRSLARHVVSLGESAPAHADIIALLRARTRPMVGAHQRAPAPPHG